MTLVGIDLGTTNSLVAVFRDGAATTLPNERGEHLTPSAVAASRDGAILVGRAARDRLAVDPSAGRAFFKRDMGTDLRYRFGGAEWSPAECSAWVLTELKRVAERHLGEAVSEAVITVPAYFRDAQRRATLDAAAIAGLAVPRLINEPTAAALAYGFGADREPRRLLVFDLGGGTFDVTLVESFDGVVEVRASAGDSRLGGEDFTDALLDLVLARCGWARSHPRLGAFRQRLEAAKRRLGVRERTGAILDDREVVISRADLAEAGKAIVERLAPIVRRCLSDGRTAPAEIDRVVLVGGATRMALVAGVVARCVGREGVAEHDPDRVVALGAAVQAALCADDRAVSDVVLTDVCPHTLGIEIAKMFARGHHEPGFYLPIIDRNTTLPVSRVETVETLHPDQDVMEVEIYQGEARQVKDNACLGTLRVPGLRHRPGQRDPGVVDVRFSHDMSGVLEVEVTVRHSGDRYRAVVERRPGAMTAAQIEAAVERLRPLKVRPRDRVEHRARIERAHRLFEELTGPLRQTLALELDRFEAALESQDDARVREVARDLDHFLEGFLRDEGEDQSWLGEGLDA